MSFSKTFYRNSIIFLALLQVLSASYFLRLKNFYAINAVLFLLCGLAVSICVLHIPLQKIKVRTVWNRQLLFKCLAILAFLPFSYHFAGSIMDGTPLKIEYADMLPIIGVMCQRFLAGQWMQVYQPIPQIWGGIQPIYLPALWLPFTFSFLFHFDIRWITVSGIWLSILLCILPLWKKTISLLPFVISILILLAWFHFDKTNNVIRLTEEGVVFFYYTLMAVAIISYNPFFIGLAAALCLLSRYAIIGWIPFAAIALVTMKQYKFLLKTAITGATAIALLTLPFGWHSFAFQFQLPHEYIAHAKRVFNENPEYFFQSPGMAKFFVPDHLEALHYVLLIGSFLIPIVFLLLVKKKFPLVNVLLAGFQLTITFFYNFLDVSYLYLFYTPVFVSLGIAGWSIRASSEDL